MRKLARLLLAVVLVGGSSAFMVASAPATCSASSCSCSPKLCRGGPTPCAACPSCGYGQPVSEV